MKSELKATDILKLHYVVLDVEKSERIGNHGSYAALLFYICEKLK